jgi:hypothetical protein
VKVQVDKVSVHKFWLTMVQAIFPEQSTGC